MAHPHELKESSVTVSPADGVARDNDQYYLNRLGKKPVLKRNFGLVTLLGFSCTVLVTWEGILLTFGLAYGNGGPTGSIIGYIFVWLGMICTYTSISELVSMAPTSGGQYHWVSMLAPRSMQNFLSYITGWLTLIGWQATCASGAFNSALFIQGLIALCNANYVPAIWHATLIAWAVLVFAVVINTAASSTLAKFEGMILVLHILGFFAILIPLVSLAPHNTVDEVFKSFINAGGFETQTYSFFVGLVGAAYSFVGADAAAHMAEEIRNAAVVIPRAILVSIGINGTLGFAMLIALLFSLGDPALVPDTILSTPLGFPLMQVFLNATKSIPGTAVMTSIILTMGISSTVGLMASCSRMFWAFARDKGLPNSDKIVHLDPRTSIPVVAVAMTSTISALLALIGIGSPLAFSIIVSVSVVGLFASYIVCISLLFWRRITGAIVESSTLPVDNDNVVNTAHSKLAWGPFHMSHFLGVTVNGFAVAFLTIVFLFAFWPGAAEVTPATMNWASLIFGSVVLFSILYYVAYARKVYKGPVVEFS